MELVKKGQKLFTSMEVSPKFAGYGKAYLVGLAATDNPASLGTEMLTFSASAAHNPLANRKRESCQSLYRCRGNGDRTGRNPGRQTVPVCPRHGAVYQKRAVR